MGFSVANLGTLVRVFLGKIMIYLESRRRDPASYRETENTATVRKTVDEARALLAQYSGNNSLNLLLLKLLWGVCTSAMGIHSAIVS